MTQSLASGAYRLVKSVKFIRNNYTETQRIPERMVTHTNMLYK